MFCQSPPLPFGITLKRVGDDVIVENPSTNWIRVEISSQATQVEACMETAAGEEKEMTFHLPRQAALYYYKLTWNGGQSRWFGERVLPLDGAINVRDMGGYETTDGKFVKWGMLYRGDQINQITDADCRLLERARLRTIVDFRSEHEQLLRPNRTLSTVEQVYCLDPNSVMSEAAGSAIDLKEENEKLITALSQGEIPAEDVNASGSTVLRNYRKFITSEESTQAYAELVRVCARADTPPLLQHCRGGKDRTGLGAAILLFLLGVKQEQIVQDYTLTALARRERNALKMEQYRCLTENQAYLDYLESLIESRASYIEASFDEAARRYGSFAAYTQQALGVTEEMIAQLRQQYLET